jgi:ABC-2 type transport system ATP-binding protein
VWSAIRSLVAGGTTVLLTTQYLEEADQLADRIVVIDRGRVIAEGRPEQLKAEVGGDRLDVAIERDTDLAPAREIVARAAAGEPQVDPDTRTVSAPVTSRAAALVEVVRELADARIEVADIGLRRPTLDDVFLRLTGHRAVSADREAGGHEAGDGDAAATSIPRGTELEEVRS